MKTSRTKAEAEDKILLSRTACAWGFTAFMLSIGKRRSEN